MSQSKTEKPIVTFYEYLRTWGPHNGWLDKVENLILSSPHLQNTSDKNLFLEHLRNEGASQKTIDNFLTAWKRYTESSQATREVRKQVWDDKCNEFKKEETYLIKHYAGQIRNDMDYYDQSFEDKEEENKIRDRYYAEEHKAIYVDKTKPERTNAILDYDRLRSKKPDGMSDAEYDKKLRHFKALATQLRKERETDQTIRMHTPWWVVHNKVGAIRCGCDAEKLRRGIYCKTCRLMLRVDKYLMELFKDAAEGRLSKDFLAK